MTLVALSASYGALGSVIGPRVAEELGVPFIDRAIPLAVAEELDMPLEQADADEERPRGGLLERILATFADAEPVAGPVPVAALTSSDDFRRTTEQVLLRQARTGEGVILGRGAVFVLRDDPRALRVRLDGPPEARVRQAMRLKNIDLDAAERGRRAIDRAHAEYARDFYGADITDARAYHLTLDATAFPVEVCVELIAAAARAL